MFSACQRDRGVDNQDSAVMLNMGIDEENGCLENKGMAC